MEHSGDKQLDDCLDRAETSAGIAYDQGAREAVRANRLEKFRDLEGEWEANKHLVLKAADFTGKFARLFADFDDSPRLRLKDMQGALAIVRDICTARREAHRGVERLDWCS